MPTVGHSSLEDPQLITELLTSGLVQADDEHEDSAFDENMPKRKRWRIGMFWYTFGLLTLLLAASALAGYGVLHVADEEPRIQKSARQIVSLIDLTRTTLLHVDLQQRPMFIDTLSQKEHLRLIIRSPQDQVEPVDGSIWSTRLSTALRNRLGATTIVASSVNGMPGLWVSFTADNEQWWLSMERSRIDQGMNGNAWLMWFAVLAVGVLIGAALLARLVSRPLDSLAMATKQVSEGDYDNSRLDESVRQAEVYTVNARFNRMAEQLARIERERAQMLAGISHDLRTPLARLRLELEMSVPDDTARDNMAADIEQVGATLNKFLDYARPTHSELSVIDLRQLIRRCARQFHQLENMSVQIDIPRRLHVLADETELGRVMVNLLENAHRYGQTPGTGFTRVRIAATAKYGWARLRVRDYGEGVPEAQIDQLTRPFFRGDSARQNAGGTGLGLAIAARMIDAMGGHLRFVNAASGGLLVLIRLQLVDGPGRAWAENEGSTQRAPKSK